jgi:hypothetical protein
MDFLSWRKRKDGIAWSKPYVANPKKEERAQKFRERKSAVSLAWLAVTFAVYASQPNLSWGEITINARPVLTPYVGRVSLFYVPHVIILYLSQ